MMVPALSGLQVVRRARTQQFGLIPILNHSENTPLRLPRLDAARVCVLYRLLSRAGHREEPAKTVLARDPR